MARFLVKASEFKNVCKAVNDRKLAELKKEIIEILKKQDEKEVKKAIDYFNSQELHYTHLEKSLSGKWIEKAGYGVGTVRIWKGKKYKKIAPGKWARVFEKEGRGTNVAVGRLIAQIGKIDNIEDLEKFVAANKQRFVDENGVDLPVVEKIKAAADSRNENVGSKEKTVEDKIKENPDYPFKPKTDKERAERAAFEKDRDDFIERMDKIRQENKKKDSKPAEKKSPEKLLKEMGFETMEKVSFNGDKWEVAGVNLDYNGNANGISLTPDRQAGNLHSSNVTVFDIDKIQKNKPAEKKKTFKQEMNQLYDAQDKAWEGFESGSEIKSNPENSKKFYDRVKKFVEENNIKLTEKHRAEIEDQNGHSFNEALALAGAYGEENKKRALAKNRENAEKYKGSVLDLSQIDEFKESGTEEKKFTVIRGGKEIQIPESKIKENIDSLNEQIEDIERKLKDDSYKKNWKAYENEKKELQSTLEVQKDMLEKIKNGVYKEESEAEKTQNRSDAMKGNKNAVKVGGEKDVIGTFKKSDDGSVEMPANKEVKELFDSLKKAKSDDENRLFMTEVYYDGDNIVTTDGRRLVSIKAGDIGLDKGYVKVDTENGKIKVTPLPEITKDYQFPNYQKVIPVNNNQEVKLNNKALKDKLKEMKKEGAYTKDKPFITLEFEDGKILLDGTVVGTGNVDFGDEEKFINFNAQYLTDASLSGDNASMFISDDPNKAVSISTNNSDTVIMPVKQNKGKMDYLENRAAKSKENNEKAAKKEQNRKYNEEFISKKLNAQLNIDTVDKRAESIDSAFANLTDEGLKREYERLKFNLDKAMDKKMYVTDSDMVDSKLGLNIHGAVLYKLLKERHPEVVDKVAAELEKRGIQFKKSLFDDLFEIDIIAADELEDEEELKENETEYNDYTAEQPELFNSPEFAVREALNRRFNCR